MVIAPHGNSRLVLLVVLKGFLSDRGRIGLYLFLPFCDEK
jgi:hypothetical protein